LFFFSQRDTSCAMVRGHELCGGEGNQAKMGGE
jgi:hypothetical protein